MIFFFPFYTYTPACSLRTIHILCTWTWSLQPTGNTMKCRIQNAHPWSNMEYCKHIWFLFSSMSSINSCWMQDLGSCHPSTLLLLLRDLNKCHSNQGKHLPMTEEIECPSVGDNFQPWFVWGLETNSHGMGALRKTSLPSPLTAIYIAPTFFL